MRVRSLQSCLTLCGPIDCSPPGSSVYGIVQARILEWVAMSSSRGSSPPRDGTCVSCLLHWQAGSLSLAPPIVDNNIGIVPDAQQSDSVQFSRPVVADSLRPHGLQHARLPSPSPTPGACCGTQPFIYIYPFSPKPPSHPGCHITLSRVPCAILQVEKVYYYTTYWYM